MINGRYKYNVNKNTIEYLGRHFAYCNHEGSKIANRLNKLSNENEQLKSYLEHFQDTVWTVEYINKLEKENKELKSHINDTEIAVEIETTKCIERVFDLIDDYIQKWGKTDETNNVITEFKELKNELVHREISKNNKIIIIGDIKKESYTGTPVELFKIAINLSQQDEFKVYSNNPQFIEALEVLTDYYYYDNEGRDVKVYYKNNGYLTEYTFKQAYDYLGDVYDIINKIDSSQYNELEIDNDDIERMMSEYESKYNIK